MLYVVLYEVCILGNGVDRIEETSNDYIARLNSMHELECLLVCDPYNVKLFLKVL